MMSWLFKLIGDYFRLSIFAVGILLGVQIPAFVDQYEKRVDAHLVEAQEILKGFQITANRYFDGSVTRLIAHYRNSQDRVFKDDADNIEFIVNRVSHLENQQQSLATDFFNQVRYLALSADKALTAETFEQYSYVVPLSVNALVSGALMAVVFVVFLDLFNLCCARCYRRIATNKSQTSVRGE